MHFTQEDYIKIENWLHRNSVKDTEFQEALPFTGKEIVTIVQDGHNRKVNIQEFINQLYKHGVEDFLNVTNTYRANNITLKEAIRLIPAEARKEGQVITFLNTDGNWEIYQFIGKLNQWNNPTLWNNPFDWEKLIVDSILPDEEDLTKSAPDAKGNSYLSLKDRKYEPDKYSGLGRKILRRRVVEIEDPIYGTQEKNLLLQADFAEDNTVYIVRYDFTLNGQDITLPDNSYIEYEGGSISDGNITEQEGGMSRIVLRKNTINGVNRLTQDMISKPNTIYEIKYDFDLDGKEIKILNNSILQFEGGKIVNGSIFGNNTIIIASQNSIFNNVDIKGTWNINNIYSDWFEDIFENNNIKNIINLTNQSVVNNVYIKEGVYTVSAQYNDENIITVNSNTNIVLDGTINLSPNAFPRYRILRVEGANISITGKGSIVGDKDNHTFDGGTHEWGHGIAIRDSKNVKIDGISISKCTGDGMSIGSDIIIKYINTPTDEIVYTIYSEQINISNVNISECRRQGITIANTSNALISNCHISLIKDGADPMACIDIEPDMGAVKNITISNCVFKDSKFGVMSFKSSELGRIRRYENLVINNCIFDNLFEGLYLVGYDNASITNCIMVDCSNLFCRVIKGCSNVFIRHCKFFNRSISTSEHQSCIFNTGDATIENCYIEGIYNLVPNIHGVFSKCTFKNIKKLVYNTNSFVSKMIFSECTFLSDTVVSYVLPQISIVRCYLTNCSIMLIGENSEINNNVFSFNKNVNTPIVVYSGNNYQVIGNTLNCEGTVQYYFEMTYAIENCTIKDNTFVGNSPEVSILHNYTNNATRKSNYIVNDTIPRTCPDINSLPEVNSADYPITNGMTIFCRSNGKTYTFNNGWKSDNNEPVEAIRVGSTSERPTNISIGYQYFDTSINKPIYWTGTKWVDATGADV